MLRILIGLSTIIIAASTDDIESMMSVTPIAIFGLVVFLWGAYDVITLDGE